MSLGNWEQWSVDHEGRPCDRLRSTTGDHYVMLYKNWVYVCSTATERPVLTLHSGNVRFDGLYLSAYRGPQDGVFFAAWVAGSGGMVRGLVGCVVEAYDRQGQHIDVTPETRQWFAGMMHDVSPWWDWAHGDEYAWPTELVEQVRKAARG